MTVFTYIRVSGRGQLDGDGPDRQRESIGKFCKANGCYQGKEFFEKAVSGTVEAMDRPVFAAMLAEIDRANEAGTPCRVVAIVVERMDRLARDLMVSEVLLAECRKRHIKVFSADQGSLIDMAAEGADPTRVLIRQILGALSQWEKSMLVMKLKAARDRKTAELGRRCEGSLPFGSFPGEQHIIDLIHGFRFRLDEFDQPMRYTEIAKHLNESGFRTRHGKLWSRFTVADVIERRKPSRQIEIQ